jgi:amidase/aspartyl-tRNA(Asn)/glutamyl-tRNA(Gln) amidotransferase subunit A
MDIPAWQDHKDPATAATHWRESCARLTAEQAKSIWAWRTEDGIWGTAPSGPLSGVPYAAKDLFHAAGHTTRGGGNLPMPRARKSSCLLEAMSGLGAVLVGKTQLHEFAYGLTGENPHHGHVVHPQHPDRDAGGSSSGSAAAVAAGCVPLALGTDTAGSLRVPASYCGLWSWRGIPRHDHIRDVFPLAPSFDTAGWLTRTAADCARLWKLLHGSDGTPLPAPRGAYLPASALGLTGLTEHLARLDGIAGQFTPETLAADHPLASVCRGVGPTYVTLSSVEACAVHQGKLDRHRERYGEAVWQRLDRGRHWTAAQLDEARLHALCIRAAYDRFFADHDFLITPVTLEPAPRVAGAAAPELRDTLLQLNTHVSIAGRPAISLPVPVADGLTLGLQIVVNTPTSSALPTLWRQCEGL